MKYLKKFSTEADYQIWAGRNEHVTPNCCWIVNGDEVHFEKYYDDDGGETSIPTRGI